MLTLQKEWHQSLYKHIMDFFHLLWSFRMTNRG
uniref:Uncharacterized protein n=1 Tax=Arundo donax TaxID=35708 RepID=A0A0A9AZA7_ARUDO